MNKTNGKNYQTKITKGKKEGKIIKIITIIIVTGKWIIKLKIIVILMIIVALITAIIEISYHIVKICGISKNCALNKCGQ